jgi:hypothetical protein
MESLIAAKKGGKMFNLFVIVVKIISISKGHIKEKNK